MEEILNKIAELDSELMNIGQATTKARYLLLQLNALAKDKQTEAKLKASEYPSWQPSFCSCAIPIEIPNKQSCSKCKKAIIR